MRRSFAASVGVHLLIVVLAIVGLPSTPRVPDIAETPVVVDLVSLSEPPVSSPKGEASKPEPKSAAQSKPQTAERQPEPPSPPTVEPKPEVIPPPQPEKAPPPEPEVTAPPPPPEEPAPAPAVRPAPPQPPVVAEAPEAKVALPEPVAESKPEPEPVPEPVVAEATRPPLPVAARKPTPPERPREVAEEAEPAPPAETAPAQPSKPREEEADFASVSKAVRGLETPSSKRAPAAGDTAFEDRLARALGTGGATGGAASPAQAQPVTSGEIEAVRRQIERCWNLPSGVKEADNVIVAVRVTMNADGTPLSATIEDGGSMQSNPHYRAAAESAVRAVLNPRCHPFKLPPEKYQTWKTMTLVFNPKEMFGT
jgi:outer membrane biosynthesis protein TonB